MIILLALTFMSGIHAKEWKENDRGLLIELTAGYGHATSYVPSESYASISPGIGLGGSFSITPCLKLTGRYLFVGYSSRNERERAYVGEQDFLLDANVARLQIGLQVLF